MQLNIFSMTLQYRLLFYLILSNFQHQKLVHLSLQSQTVITLALHLTVPPSQLQNKLFLHQQQFLTKFYQKHWQILLQQLLIFRQKKKKNQFFYSNKPCIVILNKALTLLQRPPRNLTVLLDSFSEILKWFLRNLISLQ